MGTNGNTPQNLTTREAADLLRVHTKTLARWRAAGTGPAWVRVEGRILYPATDVHDYLATRAA